MGINRGVVTLLISVLLFCGIREYRKRPMRKEAYLHKKHSNAKTYSCHSSNDCFEEHMNNSGFAYALQERCRIGNRSDLHSYYLTFTHIPKCGGSSLRYLLHKHFKSRFQRAEPDLGSHIPFFLSQKLHPKNIFITVLREPTSLAISLYNYINMQKTMPAHLMLDKFWLNTYKRDPVAWSEDLYIRAALRNQVLRFFTWYSKSAKYGKSDAEFANPRVWHDFLNLPETYHRVMDPWVPWTEKHDEALLKQTTAMPPDYRCTKELQAVSILIQRYSAVGVMEDYATFFEVLHQRAELDDVAFSALMIDSRTKRNPSSNTMSKAKMETVKSNLQDLFFCSRVLWKLASMINRYDSQCYAAS